LLVRDADALGALDQEDLAGWRSTRGTVVALSGHAGTGLVTEITDVGGTYERWFADNSCDAVIVRPDWYVFGSAPDGEALAQLMSSCVSKPRPRPTVANAAPTPTPVPAR